MPDGGRGEVADHGAGELADPAGDGRRHRASGSGRAGYGRRPARLGDLGRAPRHGARHGRERRRPCAGRADGPAIRPTIPVTPGRTSLVVMWRDSWPRPVASSRLGPTGWDAKFPDDGPAYAHAVAELDPHRPARSCSTPGAAPDGRCPTCRAAVGPTGRWWRVDATPEMLAAGRRAGQLDGAGVTVADACGCRCATGASTPCSPPGCCRTWRTRWRGWPKLARVCGPAGWPCSTRSGRATLAARHGSVPSDDDVLLGRPSCRDCWRRRDGRLLSCDDAEDRYLALAVRSRVAT